MLIELIQGLDLKGRRIHDANVVATMLAHGMSLLLTENVADFSEFAAIRLVDLMSMEASSGRPGSISSLKSKISESDD